MGFFSKLFGGSESTSVSKPIQTENLTAEQMELIKKLAGQVSLGPQAVAPAMSVETTPEEQQYFDWTKTLAQTKAVQDLLSGQPGYESGPEYAEQFYQENIKPTAMREFQEITLPGIRNAYTGPGYYGSARQGAEVNAYQDLAQNLAAQRAELMYKEELARRQSIEDAYDRVTPAAQTVGQAVGSAGEYSRMIEQEKVAEQLQRFLMGEEVNGQYSMAYNPNVTLALNLLGISPYTIGTETTTTKEESGGIIPALSGLAKGIAALK